MIWLLTLGCSVTGQALADGLEASLGRTRILEGETVLLTLIAPGDSWGVPELGPLGKDFEVDNQGQSTRMTIVNGRSSSTREWQFLLAPKRSGRLTIPALKVGDLTSEPLAVDVLPAARAGELGEAPPVLLEVETDRGSPYVQGQVIYSARVLVRVNLSQAALNDPVVEGAVVERLGEDRRYEIYRDGQKYQVIERRYALFPQHSGTLQIASPVLSGAIAASNPRHNQRFGGSTGSPFERFFGRDPFEDFGGLMQRTRPIQVRGPTLTLDVRPQPAGSASPWLPAESLQLAETWTPGLDGLRVGEPVTRTIAVTAQGLTAAQLPDLLPDVPTGVKVYPDKPRTETRAEGDDLISLKELKLAIVPSVAGDLTLPEVRLHWWDTVADQERVALLPARVLQVSPALADAGRSAGAPSVASVAEMSPVREDAGTATGSRVGDASGGGALPGADALIRGLPNPTGYWPWISIGLALAWLLTLGLWLRERRVTPGRRPGESSASSKQPPSLHLARALVKRACATSDARAARKALLSWAGACWPTAPSRRLQGLAERLGGTGAEALLALDRSLYAADGKPWDGQAAWATLGAELTAAERRREAASGPGDRLPPLYP